MVTKSRSAVVWMGSEVGWFGAREGRAGGRTAKRPEETFGGEGNVPYLDCGDCSTVTYLKLTKLYTLNILVCSLLHINYTQ